MQQHSDLNSFQRSTPLCLMGCNYELLMSICSWYWYCHCLFLIVLITNTIGIYFLSVLCYYVLLGLLSFLLLLCDISILTVFYYYYYGGCCCYHCHCSCQYFYINDCNCQYIEIIEVVIMDDWNGQATPRHAYSQLLLKPRLLLN